MIVSDTLQLALRNLGQAKLRTALTTLGVSIGIASLAGMVSLGVGLQDQIVGRFLQAGVFDSITVMPSAGNVRAMFGARGGGRGADGGVGGFGAVARAGGGGRGGRGTAAAGAVRVPLDDDAIAKIKALPDVKDVYPNIRFPVEVHFEQADDASVVTGIPDSSRSEGAFQTFTAGGFFANDTDKACVLTLDMVKRLTDAAPATLIGQSLAIAFNSRPAAGEAPPAPGTGDPTTAAAASMGIRLSRKTVLYRIAGIVDHDPGGGIGSAGLSGIMIPLAQALQIESEIVTSPQSLLRDPSAPTPARSYSSLTLKVTRAQSTQDVEDKVKALGYNAISLNDLLQGAKRVFILLDILLSLIGSIALAVSSLGIVNTMVMSILERTREIGIMKAIGGSDSDVRRIFLVEASAIGLLGGVVGIALGWAVGRAINIGANVYIVSQGGTATNLFSLPLWLIAGSIGFSWLVSLLAGSYPASRAARLDPIQALRHD